MNGRRPNGKVGIALAGGGPLGAIYEIGALVALEKALKGMTLTDLDVYVGVSSGAFLAAGLANGIAPSEMHAMFILDRSHHDPFETGRTTTRSSLKFCCVRLSVNSRAG